MTEDQDYNVILLEEINSKLKAILEGQKPMASVPGDIKSIKDDISELKDTDKTMKAVIKAQSKILNKHETRIVALETV